MMARPPKATVDGITQSMQSASSHDLSAQTPQQINLGGSILRRAQTQGTQISVPSLEPGMTLAQQQSSWAKLYFQHTQAPTRCARIHNEDAVIQDQPSDPLDDPFRIDFEYEEIQREYDRKRLAGLVSEREGTEFMMKLRDYEKAIKERGETLFVPETSGTEFDATGRDNIPTAESDIEAPPAKRSRHDAPKKRQSKPAGPRSKKNMQHLGHDAPMTVASNVFADIEAANGYNDNQPAWDTEEVGHIRSNALRALVNNVPPSCRGIAATDRKVLEDAIKGFTGLKSVKPARGGKWLVSGMKTSLTPHQVIGTSFMRRRESGEKRPRGGILADQMGLGKTLMALANIINGRPNSSIKSCRGFIPDNQNCTTLIIVPSALLTQWSEEIQKHTETSKRRGNAGKSWGLGSVMIYSEKIAKDLDPEDLLVHDIILTTYNEVSKSWPVLEVPDMEEGPERDAWYEENFYSKRGLLHRTMFLRICLDEAHQIRNPETRVSNACRNLVGQHCWAITGTPMVNGSFDLYALFEFIGHPTVKCPTGFKKKYCDGSNPMSVEKLSNDLSSCMSRFTHRDHLFGARLVNLPKARGDTLKLDFTRLEFEIYEIVRIRFAARIQQMSKDGVLRSKLTHIWVLMLRLRQLTSHPLMIQGEICSCLEPEDFDKLERLVGREDIAHGDGASLIISIRNILHKERAAAGRIVADHQDGADEQHQLEVPRLDHRSNDDSGLNGSGNGHGRNMRPSKYLEAIKASKSYQQRVEGRAKCATCFQPPIESFSTDCGHHYCKTCLEDLVHDAAANDYDKASCAACGREMTARPTQMSNNDEEASQGSGGKKKVDSMADWLDMNGEVLPSTKTIATKSQILNWWDPYAGGDQDVKVIIFTQWLGMVKVLSKMCETEEWGYCTLTGNMSRKQKDNQLNSFKNEKTCRILISSLKCGGIGLNLTVASKVIIIDPWWNEAIEQQAFCRVFRIGQQRETSMVNLAIKGSVDERLFDLKQRKKMEIDTVMLNHKERRK